MIKMPSLICSESMIFKLGPSALAVRAGLWLATSTCCMSLFFSGVSTAHALHPSADRAPQNCRGSAGYVWSVVAERCIRLFEVGLAFTPDPSPVGRSIQLAYVVLAPPAGIAITQAEVFVPGKGGSILLNVVPNQEGDTRPTLLLNTDKKVRIFRVKDDHILDFKGLRYRRCSPVDDPLFQLR